MTTASQWAARLVDWEARVRERCDVDGHAWRTVASVGLRAQLECRWCGLRRPQ
jgi:hypothetical protein